MREGAIPLNPARMLKGRQEARPLLERLYKAGRRLTQPLCARWAAHKPASSRVEDLREKGFAAVWGHLGDKLARENGRLDNYLRGNHAAMSNIWTRLRAVEASIQNAKRILDVTAMNGMMSHHLLNNASEGRALTIYVNEVSDRMREKLRLNLYAYIDKGGMKKAVPICLDMSGNEAPQEVSGLDIILWWGSFQMVAGRYKAIGNAFDMLREGGCFVLMDIYPHDEARLLRYGFGNDTVHQIAIMSKALDMGEDVKGLISKAWTERMARVMAGSALLEIGDLDQPLIDQPLSDQRYSRMRCIYAIKPGMRTGTQAATHETGGEAEMPPTINAGPEAQLHTASGRKREPAGV